MVISIIYLSPRTPWRLGWAGLVAAMDIAMWREDWRLMAEGILWSYVETLSTIQ